jgi:hypothetical protein
LVEDPPKKRRFNLKADALPPDTMNKPDVRTRPRGAAPKLKGRFLGGSFPWPLFCIAARLPGKALVVWQLVHRQRYMTRKPEVALPSETLTACGVTRQSLYRALDTLERVGLIVTNRTDGRSIRVALVELPEEESP